MANFTAAGNTLALGVADRGDTISVALSGTYAATVALQRERGSAGSGSWVTIKSWNTPNATVAYDYITRQFGESLRLNCTAFTSGTVVATLTHGNKDLGARRDALGNSILEYHQAGIRVRGSIKGGSAYPITAALTVSPDLHADLLGVFTNAAGATVTLPAATGSGDKYRFFINTTVTSVAAKIQVANSVDIIAGGVIVMQDAGSTVAGFETGAADDTCSMNGTTTGGIRGDYYEFEDAASGIWRCTGICSGTGTEATPFSSAV